MRRNPGARKKIVAVWVAVLATVATIAATAAPVAAEADPNPAQATLADPPGGTLATDLFTALAKGAAGKVGGVGAGWALGAMGLGQGDSQAISEMSSQLETISNQLQGIQQTLNKIANEIQVQTCDLQVDQVLAAVSAIDTANGDYQQFFYDALVKNQNDTPQAVTWASNVLNGTGDIGMAMSGALNIIKNAMIGPGGTGILATCLDPSGAIVPLPGAGTTNFMGTDASYYGYGQNTSGKIGSTATVNDFMGYYYGYEALGLMMLQEAYHLQAEQAAGQTGLTPDQVGDLCANYAQYPQPVGFACGAAENVTNTVYQNLYAQFQQAGLPYTDGKVILRNAGDYPLFVRSVDDFTKAAGGTNCVYPLTSASPCGVTTATWATVTDPMQVPYDGYSTWQTMNSGQVTNLVGNRGSLTPGQYMDSIGFQNAEHKIILESTSTNFVLDNAVPHVNPSGTMICFFHTDLTGGQFCSGNDVTNRLLQKGDYCPTIGGNAWTTKPSLPTGDHNFFSAQITCQNPTAFTPAPGWLVTYSPQSNAVQYRWPLLMTKDLPCTVIPSGTNDEGVPTRCGADFNAMFNQMVPRPTSCPGTTTGSCPIQAQVTLTGPNLSGTWATSSPILGHDVSVAYERNGQTIRKITGTVELPATSRTGAATVTFNIRRAGGKSGFFQGTIKIEVAGKPPLVVRVQKLQIQRNADGTISGHLVWQRGHHGTYTLTWSVLVHPA